MLGKLLGGVGKTVAVRHKCRWWGAAGQGGEQVCAGGGGGSSPQKEGGGVSWKGGSNGPSPVQNFFPQPLGRGGSEAPGRLTLPTSSKASLLRMVPSFQLYQITYAFHFPFTMETKGMKKGVCNPLMHSQPTHASSALPLCNPPNPPPPHP